MATGPVDTSSLVANIVLPILATIAVVLRFYARRSKGQAWKWDDYTILIALVFCLALAGSAIYAASTGLLVAAWRDLDAYVRLRKLEFSDILICHAAYGVTKISVVLFYKRIFTVGRTIIATNILLGLISLYIVVTFFTVLFCSRNISSYWTTPLNLDGTQYVMVPGTLILIYAVLDIILDLAILSTPLPAIRKLNLSLRRRIALAGTFLLGAFCLVCSCVRIYYVDRLLDFHIMTEAEQLEVSRDNILWAHIEAYASTLAACLPTLAPLAQNFHLDGIFESLRSMFSTKHFKSTSLLNVRRSEESDCAAPSQESERAGWVTYNSERLPEVTAMYQNSVPPLQPRQEFGAVLAKQDLEMQRYK